MKTIFILALTMSILSACSHSKKKEANQEPVDQAQLAKWQANMLKFGSTLSNIMPLVANEKEFKNPKNLKTIKQETKNLASITHNINADMANPFFDPSLGFVAKKLEQDMKIALDELDQKNYGVAQNILKNATNYCIGCHTMSNRGIQNLNFKTELSNLNNLERADYFAAIRSFDQAIIHYEYVLTDKAFAKQNSEKWFEAFKKMFAIAVRVKRNSNLAVELVSRLRDEASVPEKYKKHSATWKAALKEWEADEKVANKMPVFEKIKNLIKTGNSLDKAQGKTAGLAATLRASLMLHEFLDQPSTTNNYAEALYLSGVVAETLQDLNYSTMSEAYFEACVRHPNQHEFAKECLEKYKKTQMTNFKTKSIQSLPEQAKARIFELENITKNL